VPFTLSLGEGHVIEVPSPDASTATVTAPASGWRYTRLPLYAKQRAAIFGPRRTVPSLRPTRDPPDDGWSY